MHQTDTMTAESDTAPATWQWPAGARITIFRWTWFQALDEYGDPVYGYGWSKPTAQLDPLCLQKTRTRAARRISLRERAHMPIAEWIDVSTTQDLPDELLLGHQPLAWIREFVDHPDSGPSKECLPGQDVRRPRDAENATHG